MGVIVGEGSAPWLSLKTRHGIEISVLAASFSISFLFVCTGNLDDCLEDRAQKRTCLSKTQLDLPHYKKKKNLADAVPQGQMGEQNGAGG